MAIKLEGGGVRPSLNGLAISGGTFFAASLTYFIFITEVILLTALIVEITKLPTFLIYV